MKCKNCGSRSLLNAVARSKISSLLSRLFINTNIFLELEFQDSRRQECKQLLEKVESGEIRSAASDFVVYSSILEIESEEGSRDGANRCGEVHEEKKTRLR
jgi:predicted nucleic acid-binding protein